MLKFSTCNPELVDSIISSCTNVVSSTFLVSITCIESHLPLVTISVTLERYFIKGVNTTAYKVVYSGKEYQIIFDLVPNQIII